MIIELHPPESAGPFNLGATGDEVVTIMRQFGHPEVLSRGGGDRPGWGVATPSGLFLSAYFGTDDRATAIEISRPTDPAESVTYDGLNIFQTPAAELVNALALKTEVLEEENGHSFTAPNLLIALWRPTLPEGPDDDDGKYFEAVLIAKPGYYDPA